MKKLLAVLLCALLALSCVSAMAENENTQMVLYEDNVLGMSYLISDDWIQITKENALTMVQLVFSGENETIQEILAALEMADMTMYYAKNLVSNISITCQDAMGVSSSMLFMLKDMFADYLITMYQSTFGEDAQIDVKVDEAILTAGENMYIVIRSNVMDMYMEQYMCVLNDKIVTITITEPAGIGDKGVTSMLTSLKPLVSALPQT